MEQSAVDVEQTKQQPLNPKTMKIKIRIAKVTVVILALVCFIMVIFILAKSSQYFSTLFSLSDQTTAKSYLKMHFQPYMSLLYLSIFGLVISVSDTILFFYKFSQKDKILWFQVIYFLVFLITGIIALTDKDYRIYMQSLIGTSLLSATCVASTFPFQCILAPTYATYRNQTVNFFIVFCIFFALFTAAYHYAVLKLLPHETEIKEDEQSKKSEILDFKKNQTFASEFDEYLN